MSGIIYSDTLQGDTIVNRAGTGAPSFSQGLTVATGETIAVDTITNLAGTGAPNFSQGIKIGGSATAISEFVNWTTFTPTFSATSGGGSASTNTTLFAEYCILGKIMFINLRVQIDVSGTVNTVAFTLPASKSHASSLSIFPLYTYDVGTSNSELYARPGSATSIGFGKLGGAAFAAGTPSANQINFVGMVPIL